MHDLEATPLLPAVGNVSADAQQQTPKAGNTVSTLFFVAGPKLYVDAAWKPRTNQATARAGLGVYFVVTNQEARTDRCPHLCFFSCHQISPSGRSSRAAPAAHFASSLNMQSPVFITECSNLVRLLLLQVQQIKPYFGK
jgi:hypothetical protein